MELLTDERPWSAITRHVARTKGRTIAAVAYIGVEGPSILPLKQGDVLVCDASRKAVKAGSTHVPALDIYRKRGVNLYSLDGLHAKVIVTAKRAFIGSANASSHSRDKLDEAVVSITDADLVAQARQYIDSRTTEINELSKADLDELRQITPRAFEWPEKRTQPAEVPTRVKRLWVAPVEYGTWLQAVQNEVDSSQATARRQARSLGSGIKAEALQWERVEARRMKVGDWFLEVSESTGRPKTPAQLIAIRHVTKTKSVLWVARPKQKARRVGADDLQRLLGSKHYPPEELVCIKADNTKPVLRLFRS